MRTVTSALFSSADGVLENPGEWQFDQFDDGLGALMMQTLARIDTVVMGRRTYEEWAPHWPTSDDPFAQFINPVDKWVASRTLTGPLEWANSRLVDGDLIEFVRALKEGDGGEISVTGSLSVVRQLVQAGVLDRLTLMVHPVLVGSGRRLFDGAEPGDGPTRLTLVDHEVTEKGNALLTYAPRSAS